MQRAARSDRQPRLDRAREDELRLVGRVAVEMIYAAVDVRIGDAVPADG